MIGDSKRKTTGGLEAEEGRWPGWLYIIEKKTGKDNYG